MTDPINLLVIAYCFPPDAEVGAMRPGRFCRYFPEFGIRPIVLTVQDRFYPGLDPSFRLPNDLRIEKTSVVTNPLNWYKPVKKLLSLPSSEASSPQPGSASTNKPTSVSWRDHITSAFEFPDQDWGWYWPALRAAEKIFREERIDAVLSTSPPVITHVIGSKLKAKFNVPWILDFRDPWTENLLAGGRPKWYSRMSLDLEQRCVTKAELVVCNTNRIRDAFVSQFQQLDADRFVTLTNGFDITEKPPIEPAPPKPFREVLHLGSLYSGRRLDGLAKAIQQLLAQKRLGTSTVRFNFIGTVDPAMQELVERETPELIKDGTINFSPRIAFQKAQQRMWNADALLLVQGGHTLQIPAKFYEYLPTGKPMLAISERGALTDILDETGAGKWAEPDDVAGIQAALLEVLALPERSPEQVETQYRRFHYRELTRNLSESIRALLSTETPAILAQRRGS